MNHAQDPGESVVLRSTQTGFEAEAIALSLRQAGIPAQPVDTASAMTLVGTGLGGARVMVRRGDLERARELLQQIEHDSASIDWDAQDLGEPDGSVPAPLSRRGAWTIVLLILLPIAVIAGLSGHARGDSILSGLGMVVMVVAGLMAAWMIFGGEPGSMPRDDDPA